MGRKRSLLKGMPIDDIITEGITKRVTRRSEAAKMYAFKYAVSNPKWAGWLMYALTKLDEIRPQLLTMSPEERARKVWEVMRQAKLEWRQLSEDQKQKYIEMARSRLAEKLNEYKEIVKQAQELEKLVDEAYREIESAVAEIVS